MRIKTLFVLTLAPFLLYGQFVDDFSNGNFTEDPPWVGDHDRFVVDNGMLRLYDDAAGMAWMSTESRMIQNTQWDFWVRIAFTPSDNNHPRIYLVSDHADLSGSLRGYFLQVGKTGSDNKRLYFCRQDEDDVIPLVSGNMNLAAASNNTLRIRIIRDGAGNWAIYADPTGGSMFIPQGEVFDDTHHATAWFGIRCTYTISNSRRFYFDDFRVGDITPEAPLGVEKLEVSSPATLDVYFNRVVSTATAADVSNYFVDQGVAHPLIAAKDPDFPHIVRLHFEHHFQVNQLYNIQVSGLTSPCGQMMELFYGQFVRYVSNRFDVVFNEIMANSRPVVALPPHDWLELYNTTDIPVNLAGWSLQYGTTLRTIPEAVIQPRGYLVLTSEAGLPSLEPYGNVVAVPGLSVNALTIGGNRLVLWDHKGELVSFVTYSDRWYRDAAKREGGWSLEKIDPYNFCQGAENWKASGNPRGGTPAETNAVKAENPNISSPRLTRTGYVDPHTIRLHFSEPMDEAALATTGSYVIDHGTGAPLSATPFMPDFSVVELTFAKALEKGTFYTLDIGGPLWDCDGNLLGLTTTPLAVPEPAGSSDIVLNEILFNPPQGGARYVELFNRSDKVVDLKDLLLASKDTLLQELQSIQYLDDGSFLFFPEQYLVLTNDTGAVKKHYTTPGPDVFLELPGMPRMTNSDGIVVLATRGHQVIDMLAYTESMHLPLLANPKGIALERLHPDRPTQDTSSWHSAASVAGFGTPGYRNSQHVGYIPPGDTRFFVEPEIFSPDGSGMDDVLNIHYVMGEPGYVANIRVFDRQGRKIKTIASGMLLATDGVVTWDGTTNNHQKASVGMYIVHVELFNKQGDVGVYRMVCVVAGRL